MDQIAKNAPTRPLDEAGAAKKPVVRWRPDAENPGDPERAQKAPASGSGAM